MLEFEGTAGRPAPAGCRVVYASRQPDGNTSLGCVFDRQLSAADLRALLD